jgi:tetratricopeptide (TPR) repeat protein
MPDEEFLIKTKFLRSMPRCLRNSLFLFSDENMIKIRKKKDWPVIYFLYDEIKDKANRFYKKKQYKKAISYYSYAFSMLKWLEFKDRRQSFVPFTTPILDEDVVVCRCYTDDKFHYEESSWRACVVYVLKNLAYAYMQLRHFDEALDCLNESMYYSQDKVSDVFFRRAQVRMYNKYSTAADLKLAICDINRAIRLKDLPIYIEQYESLKKLMEDRIEAQDNDIKSNL